MTTEREAFEAWYYSDEDHDLTDNAPSIDDVDAHHKYWMLAAWQASRKVALEDAAAALGRSHGASLCYKGVLPRVSRVRAGDEKSNDGLR